MTGYVREARGHRHVGGRLRGRPQERHYGAIIGIISAVISAAATAYGSYATAQAQEQASNYNRKVAMNQAQAARDAAAVEAANRAEHYRRQMGAQRAALAASGLQASEGTPLLVQMDSAAQAQLDLARVRYGGEVGSRAYQSEANIQKFYGKQAQAGAIGGYVGAGASLLGGVGKAYAGYKGAGSSTYGQQAEQASGRY
jgi:hypothetical protein